MPSYLPVISNTPAGPSGSGGVNDLGSYLLGGSKENTTDFGIIQQKRESFARVDFQSSQILQSIGGGITNFQRKSGVETHLMRQSTGSMSCVNLDQHLHSASLHGASPYNQMDHRRGTIAPDETHEMMPQGIPVKRRSGFSIRRQSLLGLPEEQDDFANMMENQMEEDEYADIILGDPILTRHLDLQNSGHNLGRTRRRSFTSAIDSQYEEESNMSDEGVEEAIGYLDELRQMKDPNSRIISRRGSRKQSVLKLNERRQSTMPNYGVWGSMVGPDLMTVPTPARFKHASRNRAFYENLMNNEGRPVSREGRLTREGRPLTRSEIPMPKGRPKSSGHVGLSSRPVSGANSNNNFTSNIQPGSSAMGQDSDSKFTENFNTGDGNLIGNDDEPQFESGFDNDTTVSTGFNDTNHTDTLDWKRESTKEFCRILKEKRQKKAKLMTAEQIEGLANDYDRECKAIKKQAVDWDYGKNEDGMTVITNSTSVYSKHGGELNGNLKGNPNSKEGVWNQILEKQKLKKRLAKYKFCTKIEEKMDALNPVDILPQYCTDKRFLKKIERTKPFWTTHSRPATPGAGNTRASLRTVVTNRGPTKSADHSAGLGTSAGFPSKTPTRTPRGPSHMTITPTQTHGTTSPVNHSSNAIHSRPSSARSRPGSRGRLPVVVSTNVNIGQEATAGSRSGGRESRFGDGVGMEASAGGYLDVLKPSPTSTTRSPTSHHDGMSSSSAADSATSGGILYPAVDSAKDASSASAKDNNGPCGQGGRLYASPDRSSIARASSVGMPSTQNSPDLHGSPYGSGSDGERRISVSINEEDGRRLFANEGRRASPAQTKKPVSSSAKKRRSDAIGEGSRHEKSLQNSTDRRMGSADRRHSPFGRRQSSAFSQQSHGSNHSPDAFTPSRRLRFGSIEEEEEDLTSKFPTDEEIENIDWSDMILTRQERTKGKKIWLKLMYAIHFMYLVQRHKRLWDMRAKIQRDSALIMPVYTLALATDTHMSKIQYINCFILAKLRVAVRRRRSKVIWEALNNWRMGGRTLLAFRKFYGKVRQIQRFWRQVSKRLKNIREKYSRKWISLEKKIWQIRFMRTDMGGVRTAVQLPMNERIGLAMLPDRVRNNFIDAELRARRFDNMQKIYDWEEDMRSYEKNVNNWREARIAAGFMNQKCLQPCPKMPGCPSYHFIPIAGCKIDNPGSPNFVSGLAPAFNSPTNGAIGGPNFSSPNNKNVQALAFNNPTGNKILSKGNQPVNGVNQQVNGNLNKDIGPPLIEVPINNRPQKATNSDDEKKKEAVKKKRDLAREKQQLKKSSRSFSAIYNQQNFSSAWYYCDRKLIPRKNAIIREWIERCIDNKENYTQCKIPIVSAMSVSTEESIDEFANLDTIMERHIPIDYNNPIELGPGPQGYGGLGIPKKPTTNNIKGDASSHASNIMGVSSNYSANNMRVPSNYNANNMRVPSNYNANSQHNHNQMGPSSQSNDNGIGISANHNQNHGGSASNHEKNNLGGSQYMGSPGLSSGFNSPSGFSGEPNQAENSNGFSSGGGLSRASSPSPGLGMSQVARSQRFNNALKQTFNMQGIRYDDFDEEMSIHGLGPHGIEEDGIDSLSVPGETTVEPLVGGIKNVMSEE